jgi:hypothetical protein
MRPIAPLLWISLALLSACGGKDPKALTEAGYDALGASDYGSAAAAFEGALGEIGSDTANPHFLRAKLGLIEARIRIDAAAAKREFLDLAASMPSRITDKDFSYFGQKFATASEYMAAVEVLDAGMKVHAESPALQQLVDLIKTSAEKAGDTDALASLAGLGYI